MYINFCNVVSPRSAVKRSKHYAKTTQAKLKENNISLYLSYLFENHKLPLESFQFTFTVCLLLYRQENIECQMTLPFLLTKQLQIIYSLSDRLMSKIQLRPPPPPPSIKKRQIIFYLLFAPLSIFKSLYRLFPRVKSILFVLLVPP